MNFEAIQIHHDRMGTSFINLVGKDFSTQKQWFHIRTLAVCNEEGETIGDQAREHAVRLKREILP